MLQRGVLPLVSQEVSQLRGGQPAPVAGVVPEDGVQLRPPQQLPAELLDLRVIQTPVGRPVAPLRFKEERAVRQEGRCCFGRVSPSLRKNIWTMTQLETLQSYGPWESNRQLEKTAEGRRRRHCSSLNRRLLEVLEIKRKQRFGDFCRAANRTATQNTTSGRRIKNS